MTTPVRRQISDVETLRAFAHPARIQLIDVLAKHGALTATQASELIGESPSNCSFHLRQLARCGLIEPAPVTDGRTRPWQAVPFGIGDDIDALDDAEFTATAAAVSDLWIARQAEAEADWTRRSPAEPTHWRRAAMSSYGYRWLTADELAEYQREVERLLERFRERRDPALRPEGSRPVRLYASAFPTGPVDAANTAYTARED